MLEKKSLLSDLILFNTILTTILTLLSVKTIVTGSNTYLKSYHDQINLKLLRKDNQKLISFVINNKHLLLLNQLCTHFKLIFKKNIFLY